MSDTSQGPGWWLASDGRWYPPEDEPFEDIDFEEHERKRRTMGLVILAGAAAVGVGCFLPWVKVSAPILGSFTKSGMDSGPRGLSDGVLFLALAIGAAIVGGRICQGPLDQVRATRVGLFLIAGLLVFLTVIEVQDLTTRLAEIEDSGDRLGDLVDDSDVVTTTFGAGLWLIGLGTGAVGAGWIFFPWADEEA